MAAWSLTPPEGHGVVFSSDGGGGSTVLLPRTTRNYAGASTAAVVTSSARQTVVLYDGPQVVASADTVHAPLAATALPLGDGAGPPLIAVAEGDQLSVWDLTRTKTPVTRTSVGAGLLRAVAADGSGGALFTAGDERSVYVINPRTWRVDGAWPGALKYGVGTLIPSAARPGVVFAASLTDSELSAGSCFKDKSRVRRMESKERCQVRFLFFSHIF